MCLPDTPVIASGSLPIIRVLRHGESLPYNLQDKRPKPDCGTDEPLILTMAGNQ